MQFRHSMFALVAFVVLVAAAPPLAPGSPPLLSLIDPGQGGSSRNPLAGIGPLVLIGLGVAVAIFAVAAGVILFRTRASAAPPPSPEDWWTCATCSAGNLEGAARCHACGTWRSAKVRPTPSASP